MRAYRTGKVGHVDLTMAQIAARNHHRNLNRDGIIAVSSYAYKCPQCRAWHLTHHAEWRGRPNRLMRAAAPVELQRWAMP